MSSKSSASGGASPDNEELAANNGQRPFVVPYCEANPYAQSHSGESSLRLPTADESQEPTAPQTPLDTVGAADDNGERATGSLESGELRESARQKDFSDEEQRPISVEDVYKSESSNMASRRTALQRPFSMDEEDAAGISRHSLEHKLSGLLNNTISQFSQVTRQLILNTYDGVRKTCEARIQTDIEAVWKDRCGKWLDEQKGMQKLELEVEHEARYKQQWLNDHPHQLKQAAKDRAEEIYQKYRDVCMKEAEERWENEAGCAYYWRKKASMRQKVVLDLRQELEDEVIADLRAVHVDQLREQARREVTNELLEQLRDQALQGVRAETAQSVFIYLTYEQDGRGRSSNEAGDGDQPGGRPSTEIPRLSAPIEDDHLMPPPRRRTGLGPPQNSLFPGSVPVMEQNEGDRSRLVVSQSVEQDTQSGQPDAEARETRKAAKTSSAERETEPKAITEDTGQAQGRGQGVQPQQVTSSPQIATKTSQKAGKKRSRAQEDEVGAEDRTNRDDRGEKPASKRPRTGPSNENQGMSQGMSRRTRSVTARAAATKTNVKSSKTASTASCPLPAATAKSASSRPSESSSIASTKPPSGADAKKRGRVDEDSSPEEDDPTSSPPAKRTRRTVFGKGSTTTSVEPSNTTAADLASAASPAANTKQRKRKPGRPKAKGKGNAARTQAKKSIRIADALPASTHPSVDGPTIPEPLGSPSVAQQAPPNDISADNDSDDDNDVPKLDKGKGRAIDRSPSPSDIFRAESVVREDAAENRMLDELLRRSNARAVLEEQARVETARRELLGLGRQRD